MTNRWLNQIEENIIDPLLPVIDPHHHLWNDKNASDYQLEELWADTSSGHNIVGTVFIECGTNYKKKGPKALRPVGETEYVRVMADVSNSKVDRSRPPILGIVSHADLKLGAAVDEVFDEHKIAARGLLKGIRHSVAYYPDPPAVERYTGRIKHLLLDKRFREGFSRLSPAGLSFDAWLTHEQISELIDLAREFPDTDIIFDHFGGPMGIGPFKGKQREIFDQWKIDVSELAQCQNVYAKLGGLAMPINGWGWDERKLPATSDEIVAKHKDYYLHSIDCFGPDRCMFESNFPVDKLSVSYHVLWNALKKIASRFSVDEKNQMFFENAQRIYKLKI